MTAPGVYTPDEGANNQDGATLVGLPGQSGYVAANWDFSNGWKMSGDYPVLIWQ
jgi:hypothetical protein